MHLLEDGNLIARLDDVGGKYRGSRFDHGGIVASLQYKGWELCGVESPAPGVGSGGFGICGEYGIEEPVGFDEAAIGDPFLKIGVGWLERETPAYQHMHPYPIIAPCTTLTESTGRSAAYTFHSGVRNGYGARAVKMVRLAEDSLMIDYLLTNIGHKPIATTEYSHNFLWVNGQPIDHGYRLTIGDDETDRAVAALIADGGEEYYLRRDSLPPAFRCWHLACGGITVSESVSVAPCRFAVWGTRRVISPECFVPIRLQPGESMQWSRVFRIQGDIG